MRYEKDNNRINALSELVKLGVLIPFNEGVTIYNHENGERIIPYKNGTYIFNSNFNIDELEQEDKDCVVNSLKQLSAFSISELAPVTFEQREQFVIVYDELKKLFANSTSEFITQEMCSMAINNLSKHYVGKEVVTHIAGAMNAKLLLIHDTSFAMEIYAQSGSESKYTSVVIDGESITIPITHEYVASWLYNNNIVGAMGVDLQNNKQTNGVYVFDSKKVGTEKEVGDKIQSVMSDYGPITELLDNFTEDEKMKDFFKTATPEEMIKFAKGVDEKYKKLLEGDAGNWEGYSVEEHTEAVLRNFDDAFADDVPEELYAFIKFMMLTHDLGKSKGRFAQKTENAKICSEICRDLGVNPKIEPIIQFIIGKSQSYTTNYFVMKDVSAYQMLLDDCEEVLMHATGEIPDKKLTSGLANICKILQTCDSGAYTAYGVVRDSKTGVYHRGGNYSWTRGFRLPKDARRKADMRFLEPSEKY